MNNNDKALVKSIVNSTFSKCRKCKHCGKPRNHAGKSDNVFYCNECKPK